MANILDIVINAIDQTKQTFQSIQNNASSAMDSVASSSTSAASETSSAMGSMATASGTASTGMQNTSANALLLRQNLIMVAQAAVDAANKIQEIGDKGRQTAVDFDKIRIMTGLTKKEIQGAAQELVDGGNSIQDITANFMQASLQGAKTTEEMKKFTQSVDQITAASGDNRQAFGDSVSGLRALGVQVGDISNQYGAYGFLMRNNVTDLTEFNNVVGRNGAKLAENGVDMKQAAAAVGIYTARTGNAKKSMAIFSQAVEESGGNISAVLASMNISQEQFNTAVEGMGAGGEMEQFILDLDEADAGTDKLSQKFANMLGGATVGASGFVAGLGDILDVLAKVGMAVLAINSLMSVPIIATAIAGIGTALAGVTLATVGWVVLIVAAVVAIGFALKALYDFIVEKFGSLGAFFAWVWDGIKAGALAFGEFVKEVFKKAFELSPMMIFFNSILFSIELIKKAWEGLKGLFGKSEMDANINTVATPSAPANASAGGNQSINLNSTVQIDGKAVGKSVAQTTNRIGGKTK